jgi:hypothetical protein
MSEDIVYVYDHNYAQLDSIGAAGKNVYHLAEDANKLFTAVSQYYQGEAAAMLDVKARQVTQQLDQISLDIQAIQQRGVERQEQTRANDINWSHTFS